MSPKQILIPNNQYKELKLVLERSNKSSYDAVVNTPFMYKMLTATIDLGVIVLLLVNEKTKMIDRVALSNTDHAKGAVRVSAKPFHEIHIPVEHEKNIISAAIATGKMQKTDDWNDMFTPALTPQQARLNQVGASIECSIVQPLAGMKGALIFSFYQPPENVGRLHEAFTEAYTKIVSEFLKTATSN